MRIGFVGAFGDSNLGDYAMYLNDVYDIGVKDITVFTYAYEFVNTISSRYLSGYNTNVVKVEMVDIEKNDINTDKYSVSFNTYPETPLEIIRQVDNINKIRTEIMNVDKVVVVGGGYFNKVWSANHRRHKLLSIFVPLICAAEQKKEIIFLGNTFGPFDDGIALFENVLLYISKNNLCRFSVRDELYSISNLHKLGIYDKIEILPDDLLYLNSNLYSMKSTPLYNDYCVIELYSSITEIREKISLINEFVSTMYKKYKMKVIFVPFDSNFGGEIQGKLIKDLNDNIVLHEIDAINHFLPIEEAVNIICNAKFVICMRYHMLVLAITNGVPVIQLLKDVCGDKRYYYCKGAGLLNQLLGQCCSEINEYFALSLEEVLKKFMNEYEAILERQSFKYNNYVISMIETLRNKRVHYINNFITG